MPATKTDELPLLGYDYLPYLLVMYNNFHINKQRRNEFTGK